MTHLEVDDEGRGTAAFEGDLDSTVVTIGPTPTPTWRIDFGRGAVGQWR